MSEYKKQLKRHQTEVEQLKKQLPALAAAAKESIARFEMSRLNRAQYPHETTSAHNNMKSKIEGHIAEIKRLQVLIEWEDGVQFATENIKKAQKDSGQAQAELRKLQDKRAKVLSKLERLENDKRNQIEKAQSAEQRAAAAYASALSDGDEAAEQRAEKALKLASEEVTQATRGKRGVATVVSALTIEVEKLDEAIAKTNRLLADLHNDQLRAARFLLADRLDKTAQELVNVAAQLHATRKALGWNSSLHDLYVPLQAPIGPKFISERTVSDKASGIAVEQILAA
ncbi:hypothetical protein SAMN03159489_00754 [Pseudomonas sp. NFPP07]|uniref:hypothetical protein n=1 Tax=Pseudomonas sp. NFPP07 TaxID=1566213 RepID=UPI0008EEC9F9|nr:hypothetical protein [Pseudomonas sp. NFPP07]SFP29569.1 hypothetical protein SAMN03159489_00754 [Pseudomonas sp. NFPP07]